MTDRQLAERGGLPQAVLLHLPPQVRQRRAGGAAQDKRRGLHRPSGGPGPATGINAF